MGFDLVAFCRRYNLSGRDGRTAAVLGKRVSKVMQRRKLRINVDEGKIMCAERNEEPSPLNIMLNGEKNGCCKLL